MLIKKYKYYIIIVSILLSLWEFYPSKINWIPEWKDFTIGTRHFLIGIHNLDCNFCVGIRWKTIKYGNINPYYILFTIN